MHKRGKKLNLEAINNNQNKTNGKEVEVIEINDEGKCKITNSNANGIETKKAIMNEIDEANTVCSEETNAAKVAIISQETQKKQAKRLK